jgi:hypothetical protein
LDGGFDCDCKINCKEHVPYFYVNEIILYTVIVLAKKGELMGGGKKMAENFRLKSRYFFLRYYYYYSPSSALTSL